MTKHTEPLADAPGPDPETAPPQKRARRRLVGSRAQAEVEELAPPPPVGGLLGVWNTLRGRGRVAAQSDHGLTLAFLLCIAGGTTLCLLGLAPIPGARAISFAGPLLATVIYPLWGWSVGAATRPSLRERLADNAYYLGFIFTQIALLVGFLPAGFGLVSLTAEEILRFFGIALGASLIGLVARTILIQMSYTVDEAADVVSGEVTQLARQVSVQSSAVLDHFDGLVSRLAESQSRLSGTLESSMTALTRTAASYDEAMRSEAVALQRGAQSATEAALQTSQALDQHQRRLHDSISAVAEVLGQLRDELTSQLQRATAGIHETTEIVGEGVRSLKQVELVNVGLERVDEQLTVINERLASVDRQVGETSVGLEQGTAALNQELERARHEAAERANSISHETSQAVEALGRTLQAFRQELDRLRG